MINRNTYLDGWRGLAIFFVIIGHFFPVPWMAFGAIGVELFFVLSGRLMADILLIKKTPFGKFFVRRFSRVWPVLFVFSFSMYVASIYISGKGYVADALVQLNEFLAAIGFFTNYAVIFFKATSVLDHTWSIAVEEHSYVILASICFFAKRNINTVRFLLILFSALILINGIYISYHDNMPGDHIAYWRTDTRSAPIFISAAFYLFRDNILKFKISENLILFLFIVAILASGEFVPRVIHHTVATIIFAFVVNVFDSSNGAFTKLFSNKFICMLGIYSYSLYIWQQPFYKLVGKVNIFVLLIGVILSALVSYFFIEGPARSFINKKFE